MPSSSESQSPRKTQRVGILFRYGAAEHPVFFPALEDLARQLKDQEIEVHHFGCKSPDAPSEAVAASCTIHTLPLTVRRKNSFDKFFKGFLWLLALPWIGWKANRLKLDVVFVDESVPLSTLFLRLTWRGPLAMTIHDFFADIYFEPLPLLRPIGRLLKAIDYRSWRSIDAVLPRVQATRTFLKSRGIVPPVCRVIHDACDLTLFKPGDKQAARQAMGLPEQALILVHHGVMHPNKGNDRIVRAFHTHRETLQGIHLLMVGSGSQMQELKDLVGQHGLSDRVTLTGWLPGLPEIATALQAADIGLAMRIGQAADHFHVTSTMVHNMASGLPVLAADLSGFREVAHENEHGLFFDPEDMEAFAAQCRRLADDPALRERMGFASRAQAERLFDESRLATAYSEALIETATHSKRRRKST